MAEIGTDGQTFDLSREKSQEFFRLDSTGRATGVFRARFAQEIDKQEQQDGDHRYQEPELRVRDAAYKALESMVEEKLFSVIGHDDYKTFAEKVRSIFGQDPKEAVESKYEIRQGKPDEGTIPELHGYGWAEHLKARLQEGNEGDELVDTLKNPGEATHLENVPLIGDEMTEEDTEPGFRKL